MKPTPLNDSDLMEITQRLMTHGTEAFLEVMGKMYNLAMKFERELHLNAYSYERSEHRTGYANGFKPKTLKTAAGMLKLKIPQVRGSEEPFYPSSLVRGIRSDRAFKMAIAEMYIKGVSTRKIQDVFHELCGVNVSADQVSRATRELDGELEKWRTRRIGTVKVLFADATYHKVRIDGVVVSAATFIVTGILEDGHRSILSVDTDISEHESHWHRVFSDLKQRGLRGVQLVVSDSHEGLRVARETAFPGIPWQRCQMHLQKNAQAYISKSSIKADVASDIRLIFNARSLDEANRLLNQTVEKYAKSQSKLATWMEENLPEGFTVFRFPEEVRQFLRTNNMTENINSQIKRRTQIIPAFPNVASLLRLVSAICADISDTWEVTNYRYLYAVKKL